MQSFVEFRLDSPEKKTVFRNAVNALNMLLEHYQKNNEGVIVTLERPWQETRLWGGNGIGIGCTLSLDPMPSPQYPLLIALDIMGFQQESFCFGKKLTSGFGVYDARFIAEIPQKCQSLINMKKSNPEADSPVKIISEGYTPPQNEGDIKMHPLPLPDEPLKFDSNRNMFFYGSSLDELGIADDKSHKPSMEPS